jgi:hypothetical protein
MGRDLRKYARQTSLHLIVGFILILFLIGDGLIFLIYGPGAAWMGFICIIAGLMPLLLVWLALMVIEAITKRIREE